MAKINLSNIRHSYQSNPSEQDDYALKQINLEWEKGGAYALLGPSGCGKTTLLNIISGLQYPTEGKVLFNDQDVTYQPTVKRNIAQVFQFPVIYDTMTLYDNLAFPLRNRGVDETTIKTRVSDIAEMLEVTGMLKYKASALSPDNKQKVSMGRGLVRDDVNAVLFDEPLTVIDPHLKLKLRAKLKELHQRIEHTMIYVTHDQTEALTFADKVVVMNHGEVVQVGTPIDLFERPAHTFVGYFIGSPGMNVLPCEIDDERRVMINGINIELDGEIKNKNQGLAEIGVRPEFVSLSTKGLEARVSKILDVGRYAVIEAMLGEHKVALIHSGKLPNQGDLVKLDFNKEHTRLYIDGWLATKEKH